MVRSVKDTAYSTNKARREMMKHFVCAISIALALAPLAQADTLDVYILTGQSNSLGTTNLEGATFDPGTHLADAQTNFFWSNASTASSDPNNIVLYGDSGGAITQLQMQQGAGTSPNFWGPEFGLARTLADSGASNVMILKASRGGGGNGFWLPDMGHMYGHLLSQIDAGLTAAAAAGHTFKVKGFLYLQGESNNSGEAALADDRLHALIEDVQSHINAGYSNAATDMYSVAGEIAASLSNANRMLTTALQAELAASDPAIGFFTTRDQPLKSDGIHFGRDAKLEIGRRFADAINSRSWIENPNRLAGYSANFGSVDAIPHPIVQDLSGSAAAPAVTTETFNDAGVPTWKMIDNNPRSSNPSVQQVLGVDDFQTMHDQGWVFELTARVAAGGGLATWSIGQDSDPGWGLTDPHNFIGVELQRVNGDELQVSLLGEQAIHNLGAASADEHHSFSLRGAAGSSSFDFYIDDQRISQGHAISNGEGIAEIDDRLFFTTGLGAATGVEIYWNEVSLFAVPEPASGALVVIVLCGLGCRGRRPTARTDSPVHQTA